MLDIIRINRVDFDWYPQTEYNEKRFGQVVFCDDEGNKIDNHNFDNLCEDIFKLMYELYKKHCDKNIEVNYGRIIVGNENNYGTEIKER